MTTSLATTPATVRPTCVKAETDDRKMIELWLMQYSSENTRRTYRTTIDLFMPHVETLKHVTLENLQSFYGSLTGAPSTRAARIATVKSLLKCCYEAGYADMNVARFIKVPKFQNRLAERILSQEDVLRIIKAARKHKRDHALLRVLYGTGCRVSELVNLRWRDVQPRENGAVQVCLFGKGSRTRFVLLDNAETCKALLSIRHGREDSEAVFESRTGNGRLDRVSVHRLMKKWAKAAGLPPELANKVSPHWFRHAHASHALDAGAPTHEIQATLGHADISTLGHYTHARPDHSSGRFLGV